MTRLSVLKKRRLLFFSHFAKLISLFCNKNIIHNEQKNQRGSQCCLRGMSAVVNMVVRGKPFIKHHH